MAPTSAGAQVRLWRLVLNAPGTNLPQLEQLLAPDEMERARRFLVESARRRFVVSRAGLRLILGAERGCEPSALEFRYSVSGKPSLTAAQGERAGGIQFNLAHSGEFALVAVTSHVEVGIDLERLDDRPDAYEAAARFFAPAEQRLLREAAPGDRLDMFYRLWTRKEAVLKAIGHGITSGLDKPDVSEHAASKAGTITVDVEDGRWQICDLDPAPGYLGAVAFRSLL